MAKIERCHARDRADFTSMIEAGLVDRGKLRELFSQIEPGLIRYPAVDAAVFRRALERILAEQT